MLDRNTLFVTAIVLFVIGGIVFLFALAKHPSLTTAPTMLYIPSSPIAGAAPAAAAAARYTPLQAATAATVAPVTAASGLSPSALTSPTTTAAAAAASGATPSYPAWPTATQYYGEQPVQGATVPVQFTQPQTVPNPGYMIQPTVIPGAVYG